MPGRGLFLALEGIDGSGKTTIAAALAPHLRAIGHPVVVTREPGGTPDGEALRALLLRHGAAWEPAAELLLMTAGRVQHVAQVIRPALASGRVVLTDRFVGSTIAYQGAGRGLGEAAARDLHRAMIGDLWPDLTLVLDLPAETGLARSRRRLGGAGVDEGRFETLDAAFYARVRQSFLGQAATDPARFAVIDATQPPETVRAQAVAAVDSLVRRPAPP